MSNNHAVSRRLLAAGFGAALACGPAFGADLPGSRSADPTVVFVCSFGSVKSLMATERFNRMAEKRGLAMRAISRATSEKTVHAKVPDSVVKAMALEGFQVTDVKPLALTREEATAAIRVVHISLEGIDDPLPAQAVHRPVERWDGIPSAVRDYNTARSMLVPRVDALFEELAKKQASVAATK
jgi:protein-tyrosine-phosphatase